MLCHVDIRVKNHSCRFAYQLVITCQRLAAFMLNSIRCYFLQSLFLYTKIRVRLPLCVLKHHAMKMCCGIEVLAYVRGAHIFQKSRSHL